MNSKQNTQLDYLITGSSGKTGKRVIERFNAAGLPYRAASRHSETAFDWYDTATWQDALAGIRSVYLVFSPDLAIPAAPVIIKNFVHAAKDSGVEHLVLLSGRGEEEAQKCEQIIIDSSLDWTVVRSSWFAQNFSESFFLDDVVRGQVYLPVANIKEPFIDIEDLADVVFASLTDKKHRGQIYEITGSGLLSFSEVFSEISTATNRNIDLHQVTMDEYVGFMSEAGVAEDYIALIKYLFTEVLDGRNESLTDGVYRALGREPKTFKNYVKKTAETDIWNASEPLIKSGSNRL